MGGHGERKSRLIDCMEDLKKTSRKVGEIYKALFGELDLDCDEMASEMPCGGNKENGNNIHQSKISNKRCSTQDIRRDSKKIKTEGNDRTVHMGKFDKRDVSAKRKKLNEIEDPGKYQKETSETNFRKEKKAQVFKTEDEEVRATIRKLHPLPPLPPRRQNEIERVSQALPGSRKENGGNTMSMKVSKRTNKLENQNGNESMNGKHPAPDERKGKGYDDPVLVRDISNQATTNALREATKLRHMADRAKNGGSSVDSRALYMQAALKFLQVASLFESCHTRLGDMVT